MPNFILLPRAAEELKIPFVASCGMVAGPIHAIPTVKELIDRTMREAEEIIGRMARMAHVSRMTASA